MSGYTGRVVLKYVYDDDFYLCRVCLTKHTINCLSPRVMVVFFVFQFIVGLCACRNGIPSMVGIVAFIMSNRTSQTKIPKSNVTD